MIKEQFENKVNNEFPKKRVMVIGDLMVDEYIIGKVKRISPEAPVPVLNYKQSRRESGGASNVAHNLKNLGAKVSVIGVVGNDDAGNWLQKHLQEKGIEVKGIFLDESRPTSVKTRFVTKGQQLFRVDNESSYSILSDMQEKIINYLADELNDCDAVILSDYKKGVLNSEVFVKRLIHLCNRNSVLIAVDSKSRDIEAFENADFVKPNNLELEEAVNIKITDMESLDCAGKAYLDISKAKALIVTRGAAGISVFLPQEERRDYVAQEAIEQSPVDKIFAEGYRVDAEWYEQWLSKRHVHDCFLEEIPLEEINIKRLNINEYVVDRIENHPAVSYFRGDSMPYIKYMKMNDKFNPMHEHSVERLEELNKNLEANGYDSKMLIVVNSANVILDGAHRASWLFSKQGANFRVNVLKVYSS